MVKVIYDQQSVLGTAAVKAEPRTTFQGELDFPPIPVPAR
jgi:hypothetical protein